jgi:hypothetical protein
MSYAGYSHRRGHRGRRGRGAEFWGDSYGRGPRMARTAPDETTGALRQSIFSAFSAARLVALDGSPQKAAKATELLDQTRKSLYRILAGETE